MDIKRLEVGPTVESALPKSKARVVDRPRIDAAPREVPKEARRQRTHEQVRQDYYARKASKPAIITPKRPVTPRADVKPDIPFVKRPRSAHLQEVRSELFLPQSISVSNLSRKLNLRLETLQDKLLESGFTNTAFDHLLTAEEATLIAEEYHYDVVVDDTASFDLYPRPKPKDASKLPLRAPLVTIMGHVDHGKTTLLDTLRKSSVAAKEAGGITQHIGAFSVALPGGKQITFLDTPGHAAFESMRQRGASVTDIVVLVVAADDSVMPQTKEAIKHTHRAGVSMIVAINKMDKPGVDPEKVKRDLMAHGVEVEEYGGEVQCVSVSGLTGAGLDTLESAIVSLAEILDLRAETDGPVEGSVIESSMKKGRGNVATMIITRGTLQTGSYIVAGRTWCKVRAMTDEAGKTLKSAGPGTPLEVTGWTILPVAGDEVLGSASEKEAKQVVENRAIRAVQAQQLSDIEAINEKLKGDVSGSVEAITDSISGIGNSEISLKIIDSSVGEVTESDVARAVASNGKIIAFNVSLDAKARATSRREGIEILSSNVIYKLIDTVRATLSSFLPPVRQVKVLGEAECLKIFSISAKNKTVTKIAGCRITNGQIVKSANIKILRAKTVVYDGKLQVLKHVKEEVTSLNKGNECGMQFENFDDLQEGDVIQCFSVTDVARQL
ncbi:hypothetical protein MRB53_040439 [Persea americana]|nr:hypothetical protein MRB53_040439 [Persea americana]